MEPKISPWSTNLIFTHIVQKNWLIIPHHIKKSLSLFWQFILQSTSHEVQRFNQVLQITLSFSKSDLSFQTFLYLQGWFHIPLPHPNWTTKSPFRTWFKHHWPETNSFPFLRQGCSTLVCIHSIHPLQNWTSRINLLHL